MLLFRWFLSHLSLFIIVFVIGYFLISWLDNKKSSPPADTVLVLNKISVIEQNSTQEQAQLLVREIDQDKTIKKETIIEPIAEEGVDEKEIVKEEAIIEPIAEEDVDEKEIVKEEAIIEPIAEEYVDEKEIVKEVAIIEPIAEKDVENKEIVKEAAFIEPIAEKEVEKEEIVKQAPIIEPIAEKEVEKDVIVNKALAIEPIADEKLLTKKSQIKENLVIKKDSVKNQDSNASDSIKELASLLETDNHLFRQSTTKTEIGKKWGLARHYFSQQKYSKAEKEYLELIAIEPNYADFYGELSNLYFVTRQISKYNMMLVKLARLYIKNNNINMARHTIGILSRQSKSMAYAVEQELSYKLYRKN